MCNKIIRNQELLLHERRKGRKEKWKEGRKEIKRKEKREKNKNKLSNGKMKLKPDGNI